MPEPLDSFTSDRHFQLWRYTVGHGQLLLRSNPDAVRATRVEVLFKGVDRVDLPTSFDGLTVERDGRRFDLRGQEWRGSITAIAMFSIEDEGTYADPSPLYVGE